MDDVTPNNFKYHAPTGDKARRHENVRNACQGLANVIASNCPPSRELSLAMTKIEEAMMWGNAAIARNPDPRYDKEAEPDLHPYAARRMTPDEVSHA